MSQPQDYGEVDGGNGPGSNSFVVLTSSDLVTEAMLLAGESDSPVGMVGDEMSMMAQQHHHHHHPPISSASSQPNSSHDTTTSSYLGDHGMDMMSMKHPDTSDAMHGSPTPPPPVAPPQQPPVTMEEPPPHHHHHQLVQMAPEEVVEVHAEEASLECLDGMELVEEFHPSPPQHHQQQIEQSHMQLPARELNEALAKKSPAQKCLICDAASDASSPTPFYDIQSLYVTNGYKFLMFEKLQQVLSVNLAQMQLQSYHLCRRCFSLVEDVHSMELKIGNIKEGLAQQFHLTADRYGIEIVQQAKPPDTHDAETDQSASPSKQRRSRRRKPPADPVPSLQEEVDAVAEKVPELDDCFYCPKCKKAFRKADFKSYVHHVKTECGMTKSVVCSECGKVFRNRTSLLAHRRTQHKKTPKLEPTDVETEKEAVDDSVAGRVGRRASARRKRGASSRKASREEDAEDPADDEANAAETQDVKEEEQSGEDADADNGFDASGGGAEDGAEKDVKEEPENGAEDKDPLGTSCNKCGRKVRGKDLSSHSCKMFYCRGCDMSFPTRGRYSYHWRTKHVTANGRGEEGDAVASVVTGTGKCEKCDKPVGSDPSKHMCKWYVCEVCKMQVCSKGQLRQHLLTHSSYRPFKCPQCIKTFTRKEYLTIHLRVHNDERPYNCDFCTKAFRSKTHLNNHRRLHTGEKPYICQHCGQAFPVPQNLHSHLQTHRGAKPVQCDLCQRAFRDMSHLKKHYRVHTGEKPYQCSMCGRVFASRSNCQAHERTHTKDIKQWQCTICNKGFPRKAKLREHMSVHGPEMLAVPVEMPYAPKPPEIVQDYGGGAGGGDVPNMVPRRTDVPSFIDLAQRPEEMHQNDVLEKSQVHERYPNEEVIVVQVYSYPDQAEDVASIVPDV